MLAAVSCVYPFDPEVEEADSILVIEGDILVGEECTFSVSYTVPLHKEDKNVVSFGYSNSVDASIWVEDSEGGKYYAGSQSRTIDLTDADPSLQYRLNVSDNTTGRNYRSEFKPVIKAAEIDGLSYILDKDKDKFNVGLSMHTAGSHYFKWSYVETWEYTAHYYSQYKYIVDNRYNRQGHIEPYEDGENVYYCWNSRPSSEVMIFTTKDQTEDRFVDLEFHTMPRSDQRILYMYHINVQLEPLDEEGYRFWNNLQQISDNQGGFFSPVPSQMSGNISCVEDPDEFVIGYINVAQRSSSQLYYYNSDEHFYESERITWPEPEEVAPDEWYDKYISGYVPVYAVYDEMSFEISGYTWVEEECADCRRLGGSKIKPSWWPSDHI